MPFAGGPTTLANGTLLFSAVAAIAYLFMVTWPPSPRRTAVKTLSTALLALLAWLEGGPALLATALALGAAGDAFLAHEGDKAFLGGLGSFLAAHIAYVALFFQAGGGAATLMADPARLALGAVLLAFGGLMARRLAVAVEPALKVPVMAYITAILAMGLAVLTLDRPMAIVGAFMFIASDTILAAERFLLAENSPHRQWAPYGVWSLYYGGQAAIALGFLL
ncbi:MAG: lysoplasmalogenase [Rhizobiaceae bacterium]